MNKESLQKMIVNPEQVTTKEQLSDIYKQSLGK